MNEVERKIKKNISELIEFFRIGNIPFDKFKLTDYQSEKKEKECKQCWQSKIIHWWNSYKMMMLRFIPNENEVGEKATPQDKKDLNC